MRLVCKPKGIKEKRDTGHRPGIVRVVVVGSVLLDLGRVLFMSGDSGGYEAHVAGSGDSMGS